MIDHADQLEKFNYIILKFDKDLSAKVEKSSLNQFRTEVQELFANKNENLELEAKFQSILSQNEQQNQDLIQF